MRKILILSIVLCLVAVFSASAQISFRLDANFAIPIYNGANLSGLEFGEAANFAFFIPEVDAYLQFIFNPVRFGLGLRFITFFGLINIIIPDLWVELHFDPLVVRASIAGLAAALLIPVANYNEFSTGATIVPDISAAIKLAEFFRFGVGFTLITDLNHTDSYFYSIYGFARFVITFGDQPKSEEF